VSESHQRHPHIIATGRYCYHEVAFFAFGVFIGLAYVLGSPPSTSLIALLTTWQVRGWGIIMLVSGVVGLLGAFWRGSLRFALQVEGAALLIQAGAITLLTTALFGVGGARALTAGGISAAWTIANLLRAGHIRRFLRS